MLSRNEFVRAVASSMSLPEGELSSLTFEELGLDSIQLYELDLVVESFGVLLPENVLISMERIDDVYQAYVVEFPVGPATGD